MVSEFDIIKKLRTVFPKIGDDAVLLNNVAKHSKLIVSVDTFVEEEHFDLTYFSAYSIGYKALACSISDIAACGGTPRYAFISIGLKRGDMEFVDEFYRGVKEVADTYEIEIIGGDTTKSGIIFVNVAVIGETNRFISRKGAKVGDVICVTGELGNSFAGLIALKNGIITQLTKSHLYPVLRVKEGIEIANYATSMIDISDGLIIDLSHILEESNVSAQIWRPKLPINKKTVRIADKFGVSPYSFAMNGGEDFELLFTIPNYKLNEAKQKVKFTEIGRIIEMQNGKCKTHIIDENGETIPIQGFDHFRRL